MEKDLSGLINKQPPPNFGYTFAIPLAFNFCLLVYTVYRLFKTGEWNFNKSKAKILCMISLGLIARCIYEGQATYYYYKTGVVYLPYHFEGLIFYILDNLPLLLLITIECLFVKSWYQLYLGFRNPTSAIEKYQKLRLMLPVSNILLYSAFLILSVSLYIWEYIKILIATQGLLLGTFITISLFVFIVGLKLEKEALRVAGLTQVISWNSSRFKLIRVILVICCFNKVFQLGGSIVAETKGYARLPGLMEGDQNVSLGIQDLVDALYTVIGYIGETGSFLCLICLLNVFQKNIRTPLCSNTFAIEGENNL